MEYVERKASTMRGVLLPQLQFELHPIGGRGNPRTETISVPPGDEIDLTIPPL